MRKKIFIGIGVVIIVFVLWSVYGLFFAPKKSPPATASFSDKGLDIKVSYSQPSKRGRLIFGEEKGGALLPYGKYWRLGANAATESHHFSNHENRLHGKSAGCRDQVRDGLGY